MTAIALIEQARHDGIEFAVMPTGKVKLRGHRHAIQRWTETLRPHRDEIAKTLRFTGWLRTTDQDGHERIFWPSDPADYPCAEPYQIHIRKPDRPLTADDEQRIREALQVIGEGDQAEIDAVIDQCRNDADARSYWLRRATELRTPARPRLVRCATCRNFDRLPDHPHLGRCKAHCGESAAGLWGDDARLCGAYQPSTPQ